METTLALSFLYLIRCSLHGAALKKSVPNLSRLEEVPVASHAAAAAASAWSDSISSASPLRRPSALSPDKRRFSEAIDIEAVFASDTTAAAGNGGDETMHMVSASPTHASMQYILYQYGLSQFVCALVGSFPITPNVGTAPTMYALRAEKLAPQIGSVCALVSFSISLRSIMKH
jgi:hypothetical protein